MDLKSTIQNVSLTFVTRIATFAINLIATALYSRALGPTNLGIFTKITLIHIVVINFIIPPVWLSNVFYGGDTERINQLKTNSLLYALAIILFTLPILLFGLDFLSQLLSLDEISLYVIGLSVLHIPIQAGFFLFLRILQGEKKFNYFNLTLFTPMLILFLLVSVSFLFDQLNIGFLLLTSLIAYTGGWIVASICCFYRVDYKMKLDFNLMKESLMYSIKAYFWNISLAMDKRFDVLFAATILSVEQLGYYAAAVSIINKLWALPDSVVAVFFSKVSSENNSREISDEEKSTSIQFTNLIFRNTGLILFVSSLFLAVFARPVVLILYGSEFSSAVTVLRFIIIGGITMGAARILSADYAGRGRPHLGAVGTVIASITFVLMLGSFYLMGFASNLIGAAFANSLSYLLGSAVITAIFIRENNLKLNDIFMFSDKDWSIYLSAYRRIQQRVWRVVS